MKPNDLWLEADDMLEVAMSDRETGIITEDEWYVAIALCGVVQDEAQNLDDILAGKVRYEPRAAR